MKQQTRRGGARRAWTAEEDAELRRTYADGNSEEIARAIGRPVDGIRLRARKLGLFKSPEHLQKVLELARSAPNKGRYTKKYQEPDLTVNSITYSSWSSMMNRCHSEADTSFPRYGGRGVTVCERWHHYAAFLADMGLRPSARHSIDRMDGSRGYEPGNCRWATPKEQQRNLKNNVYISAFGERKLLVEWLEDERCCVDDSALRARLRKGRMTPEQAISTPPTRGPNRWSSAAKSQQA